jgi:uncharacterized surface protein with fasciclin (FAS1) repeats
MSESIAAIAAGNPDFSILVTALEAAGLTGAVADETADLTVFAPTNAAFGRLAADLGFAGDTTDDTAVVNFLLAALTDLSGEAQDPIPLLSDILLYHVSAGAKTAEEIAASGGIDTLLAGAEINAANERLIDLEPDLLNPRIVIEDIEASNGAIQAIDRVLLPFDVPGNDRPSIFDIASGTDGFAVLTKALEVSGLDAAVDDPNAELTVFAPTDAAFAALAAELGYDGDPTDTDAVFAAIADALTALSGEAQDPIPLLTDILLYHVVPDAQSVDALVDADSSLTLSHGLRVIVTEDGAVIDADPEAPNAELVDGLTDLQASNGTVHVIDSVLLPIDLPNEEPTATIADVVAASGDGFDANGGDFDILLAALGAADLVAALDDPSGSFTVFAPTDAAFQSLATQLGVDGSSEEAAFDGIFAALTGLAGDAEGAIELLSSVLLYHVVEGEFSRTELAGGPDLTSLLGPSAETGGRGLVDADRGFLDASFIDGASDIVVANGVIQAIDQVLLPINVPDASDIIGTAGNDPLEVEPETLTVDGLAGNDSLDFGAPIANTTFGYIDGGFSATTNGQRIDIVGVESFLFSDETVVVDTGDLSAAVFRLYGVGLGREGDIAGVTFWTEVAETDGLGVVADHIISSEEFLDAFGGSVPSDDEVVEAFYNNFLGRESDPAGLAFWQDVIDSDEFDTSDLLVFFSESQEFRDITENTTDDGVLLFA